MPVVGAVAPDDVDAVTESGVLGFHPTCVRPPWLCVLPWSLHQVADVTPRTSSGSDNARYVGLDAVSFPALPCEQAAFGEFTLGGLSSQARPVTAGDSRSRR